MKVVDFMREKMRLKKEADAAIVAARNKNALGPRLKSALGRLTAEQKTEIVGSPKDVLDNIENAINKLEEYKQSLGELKLEGVAESQQNLVSLTSDLGAIASSGTEIFDGVQFILDQGKNEVRQAQFQLRHQRQRVQNKLIQGGYGQHFSKTICEVMQLNGDGKIGAGIKPNPPPRLLRFFKHHGLGWRGPDRQMFPRCVRGACWVVFRGWLRGQRVVF